MNNEDQLLIEERRKLNQRKITIENLNKKDRAFIDRIHAADPPCRYTLRANEILLIADIYENNAINAAYDYFCAGFVKGMRYAKKQLMTQEVEK